MTNCLLVSDLHFTDRPADMYRFKIFEQIIELSNKHKLTDLIVLGDLCEMKDFHSSRLVNCIVDGFYGIRKRCIINNIFFIAGNHDYVNKAQPFFHFLRRMPWASFYTEPTFVERGKEYWLFLPHTRDSDEDWNGVKMPSATHIFLHGTMNGAVSETGQKLEGISPTWFKGLESKVFAGDIHVPQKVGNVEYCGAPYHIRFGDNFQGRALALVDGKKIECPLDNIRKLTFRLEGNDFDKACAAMTKELKKGDQVKALIVLPESQLGEWTERKNICSKLCEEKGATLMKVQLERHAKDCMGIETKESTLKLKVRTPKESLTQFCRSNNIDDTLTEIGHKLLTGDEP